MLLPLSEVSNFETLFDKWQRALCKIYLYLTSSMKTDFWKRGGKVIANFCSTNKFCGFTGSRSSSLQRNPTNSIMRWCCSSIEYAVSTFHTEFMSFFLFLNGTKFSSCFILAKFSPAQAALYITSSSPFDSLPLHCFFRLDKEMPSNFFFSWPKAM